MNSFQKIINALTTFFKKILASLAGSLLKRNDIKQNISDDTPIFRILYQYVGNSPTAALINALTTITRNESVIVTAILLKGKVESIEQDQKSFFYILADAESIVKTLKETDPNITVWIEEKLYSATFRWQKNENIPQDALTAAAEVMNLPTEAANKVLMNKIGPAAFSAPAKKSEALVASKKIANYGFENGGIITLDYQMQKEILENIREANK